MGLEDDLQPVPEAGLLTCLGWLVRMPQPLALPFWGVVWRGDPLPACLPC